MEIVTAEEMREIDRHAIRSMKIPSIVLMECAGLRVVQAMRRRFGELGSRRILILCGKGNNGGDALVVARHLHGLGAAVIAALTSRPAELTGDARTNLEAALGVGVPLHLVGPRASRSVSALSLSLLRDRLPEFEIVVDGLLGTGLVGPARGITARIIEAIETLNGEARATGAARRSVPGTTLAGPSGLTGGYRLPVVAIDLPSGLSGDSSEVPGPALHALLTVALCRPKIAHWLPPAALLAGEVVVADIGIPSSAVASVHPAAFTIEAADLKEFLPARARAAHKGSFGHALIVAGGEGKSGAAALACLAALRSGAGLVTAAVPGGVRAEVASFSPEVMTIAVPPGAAKATVARLLSDAAGKTAVGLGPGLGREPTVADWVRRFTIDCPLPLVLDADGLNAFEGRAGDLSDRRSPLILTPHPGEMARLVGTSVDVVLRDRLGAVRALARTARAIVVLKGMATLVATPDGSVHVNRTGNPGMATAGSGDVLTGILASLLAQGLDPLRAVLLGVYVHGRAGDIAAAEQGEASLIATDILAQLPPALQEFTR